MPRLESLDFRHSLKQGGDEVVEHIAACRRLRLLVMTEAGLTDGGIQRLKDLHLMEKLILSFNEHLGDDGIAVVRHMPLIKYLELRFTNVGDAGCAHIATLDKLWDLDLTNTQISDDGVAHLARLPNLRRLTLQGTGITDRSLELLRACKTLESLDVRPTLYFDAKRIIAVEGPQLSDVAVQAFENDRPDVIVFRTRERAGPIVPPPCYVSPRRN
jgi:hypothetical protein